MNISIGNDHAGTDYKFRIIEFLKSKEEYTKLKKKILTSLNGKDSAAPCIVALKELFPNFMKVEDTT